jgi:hypothetical protein
MNPDVYKFNRLLKTSSHNASGGAFQSEASNCNYNIQLRDELQKVGHVAAVSVDSVEFPNLFPNVSAPFNELLVRRTDPLVDTLTIAAQDFIFQFNAGQPMTIAFPGAIGTPAVVAALNAAVALLGLGVMAPVFTFTTTGVIVMTSPAAVALNGGNWYSELGMAGSAAERFNHIYYGFPLAADAFHVVYVPTGFYTHTELGDYITAALDVSFGDPPGSWSINPAPMAMDQRYVLSNPIPFVITPRTPPSNSRDERRDLWYKMGFFAFPDFFGFASVSAGYDPNLQGASVVYLFSNLMASSNRSFDGEGAPDSTVLAIPITVPYGFVQTHVAGQWNGPMIRYTTAITPRALDISLRDVYGDLLFLPPNQQLTVMWKLWFEQKSVHEQGGRN